MPAPEPQQPVKQANQMPPEVAARAAKQGKAAMPTPAAPVSNGVPPAPAVTEAKAPTPQRPAPKPSEPVLVPMLNAYVKAHLPKAEVSRSAGVLAILGAGHAHSQCACAVQTGVYSDVTRALGEPVIDNKPLHSRTAQLQCMHWLALAPCRRSAHHREQGAQAAAGGCAA